MFVNESIVNSKLNIALVSRGQNILRAIDTNSKQNKQNQIKKQH